MLSEPISLASKPFSNLSSHLSQEFAAVQASEGPAYTFVVNLPPMYTVPLPAVMQSLIPLTAHPHNTGWNLTSYGCERCLTTCAWKPGFLFVLSSNTGKLVERSPTTHICLFPKEYCILPPAGTVSCQLRKKAPPMGCLQHLSTQDLRL